MPTDDLLFTSATRLLALLRAREISARELVDAHLAQIERVNPQLNAVVTLTAERARHEAADADRRLAGADPRPLEGLPITIKDSFEMAGVRSTDGTRIFEDHVPLADAVSVARLRAAGGIVLGKTNVPELALDYDCANPVFGRTNNPWDLERSPGGSSGGEGAAIASGCSPLGLGSDLAGSVRIPAHFCGIAALKPTQEAVPRTGHMPVGPMSLSLALMATVGPMARSVGDLALAYNVLRGPDPRDPYILPSPPAEPETEALAGLGCSFYVDGGSTPVAAPIRDAVRAAATALGDAGLRVEERVPPGLDTSFRTFMRFAFADGAAFLRLLAGDRYGEYRPELRRTIESQVELGMLEFFTVGMERDLFRVGIAELLAKTPIVLGPTLPIPAFRYGADGHDIEGTHVGHVDPLWGTAWVNLAGLPAVAVPAGLTPEGLPITVQLVGAPFSEGRLLAAAALLERALGGYQRPPSV